ncbi:MAG: DegV family EDD domain-containing protein [Clostridia bacterium]|nr:DegV family EDD domain-containing protein [Clostridia bacterium]
MKQYVILADFTCDLSAEIRDDIGMEDYVRGHIHFDDGRDFSAGLDWDQISREEFYKILSNKKQRVTTAPSNVEEYYEVFEGYVKKGVSVLSLSLSSGISSTYRFSCIAAEQIREKYPEADIYCCDSRRMSGGFGLLTICAHRLKAAGKSMEEVAAWLEENKDRVHQMGPIDDLFFIARRGRITMGKAIMGSMVGIKPMGDCNNEGYTTVLANTKGMKSALEVTVRYLQETARNEAGMPILICHSNRPQYAQQLMTAVQAAFPSTEVCLSEVFCGSGANIGPGMVGVFYLGEPISPELEKEKAVMNRILGK